jgi:hypothetical protein
MGPPEGYVVIQNLPQLYNNPQSPRNINNTYYSQTTPSQPIPNNSASALGSVQPRYLYLLFIINNAVYKYNQFGEGRDHCK